ncbi:MAG TPA: 2-phospho-L-lactate guanylyltransferase [Longimicrobiales bacterium]
MNPHGKIWAVVPVKELDRSKGRLSPLLSREERCGFARAMLLDVLNALRHSRALAGIIVVTRDEEVVTFARACNAEVLIDHGAGSMTAAVAMAARQVQTMADAGMLVVPADVPLITPEDIETIMEAHAPPPAITIVPAERDGGTNLLLCTPSEAISFHFGEDSCERHRQAACERGILPRTIRVERAALDLDRPEDIADFMRLSSSTRAYAWLLSNGIGERLRPHVSSPGDTKSEASLVS